MTTIFNYQNLGDDYSLTNGSSYCGKFECSKQDLINLIGEPVWGLSGDEKSQHTWVCEYENQIFTIYDYKYYRELSDTEIVIWHVGGFTSAYDFINEITSNL